MLGVSFEDAVIILIIAVAIAVLIGAVGNIRR